LAAQSIGQDKEITIATMIIPRFMTRSPVANAATEKHYFIGGTITHGLEQVEDCTLTGSSDNCYFSASKRQIK